MIFRKTESKSFRLMDSKDFITHRKRHCVTPCEPLKTILSRRSQALLHQFANVLHRQMAVSFSRGTTAKGQLTRTGLFQEHVCVPSWKESSSQVYLSLSPECLSPHLTQSSAQWIVSPPFILLSLTLSGRWGKN